MKLVKSSSIAAVGHDPATDTLTVRFHGGKTYRYAGVSTAQHQQFLGAKSLGKHFADEIKGKFKVAK